jgi:hypothetical protein
MTIEGYSRTIDSYFDIQNNFYANVINDIALKYLSVGQNYNLHINSSGSLDYWINMTSQSEDIIIKFSQEIDTETNVINLYLYKVDSFLEMKSWLVEPQGYNPLGNVITTLGIVIAVFVIGILLLSLFSNKKGKR